MQYKSTDITLDMFPDSFRDFIALLAEVYREEGHEAPEAQALAKQAAVKLCELGGGDSLYIPKLDSVLRPLVQDDIVRAWMRGVPYEQLARKYNLSVDCIRRICRDNRARHSKSIIDFINELEEAK